MLQLMLENGTLSVLNSWQAHLLESLSLNPYWIAKPLRRADTTELISDLVINNIILPNLEGSHDWRRLIMVVENLHGRNKHFEHLIKKKLQFLNINTNYDIHVETMTIERFIASGTFLLGSIHSPQYFTYINGIDSTQYAKLHKEIELARLRNNPLRHAISTTNLDGKMLIEMY